MHTILWLRIVTTAFTSSEYYLKENTTCFDLLLVWSEAICLPHYLHLTCWMLMDALTSLASRGRRCEIHVDLVYSDYPGLIYGSAHCNMCCLPYIEQQIECHTIHLKIKGSMKAQVSEDGLRYCGALCENIKIEPRQRSISFSDLFFLTW